MATIDTRTPYLEGGLRSTQFFNGRLLTAEDMTQEQEALRATVQRLGRTVGDGVAWGLEVTEAVGRSSAAFPVVQVEAGLALDRTGRAVELPLQVDVALAGAADTPGVTGGVGAFALCDEGAPGPYTSGQGVYLLTIG